MHRTLSAMLQNDSQFVVGLGECHLPPGGHEGGSDVQLAPAAPAPVPPPAPRAGAAAAAASPTPGAGARDDSGGGHGGGGGGGWWCCGPGSARPPGSVPLVPSFVLPQNSGRLMPGQVMTVMKAALARWAPPA